MGLTTVLWNVDPQDWKRAAPQALLAELKETVRPGSLVLLHDIHPPSLEILPQLLKSLKAEGYGLVTVPRLLTLP